MKAPSIKTAPTASPRVKVFTFGRFDVEIEGQPLRFSAKSQRRPLQLLKAVIALGADKISTEQLSESLWPDSDGDQATGAFHINLHRLRKLVGWDALALKDGRLSLEPRTCWVDALEFTSLLRAASQAMEAQDETSSWTHIKAAITLYQGPFLEGEFDPPEILSARERLHSLFLRQIDRIGESYLQQQQFQLAIELYETGLAADDLAEGLYQNLMRCFQRQGRSVEGIATYQRCRQILQTSIGIAPSPETEAIHQALLADQRYQGPPLERPILAVMPFANMSESLEQEHFCDGLSEDLITALANNPATSVIARNTVFTYKGRAVPVQTVARDLGAHYVLEGSVRRTNGRLRITAQLIHAGTEHHVWAERYDREAEDLFTIQDEIVHRIVNALEENLRREEGGSGQLPVDGAPAAVPSPETTAEPVLRARLPEAMGERRPATIAVFVISGYAALNEQLGPEAVEGIMSRIRGEADRIVEYHGGVVNQFIAEQIVALFGVPATREDEPVHAVRAAFELRDMVRRIAQEIEPRMERSLRLRAGITSGPVVLHQRDDREGRYGIAGDALATGISLASRAGDDEILASEKTRSLIADFFRTEPVPDEAAPAHAGAPTSYRIGASTLIWTRFQAAIQRGLTPFTARGAELTALRECLEKAVAGEGRFVTVAGDAGLGKSRLLFEFLRGLDRKQVRVLEGRAQPYGGQAPFLPFLAPLRQALALPEEAPRAAMVQKVTAAIQAIDPSLEPFLPLYLRLLSLESGAHPIPKQWQDAALPRALEEALAALLTSLARQGPTVLALEDWHWADASSDSALGNLLGAIAPHALLVVVLHRPDYEGRWKSLTHHVPIVLNPLDSRHSETIIMSRLGAESLPEGLANLILERSAGNPFFMEEICNSLVEEGTVQVKEGRASLARALEEVTIPDTVEAVIRSRVDRLDGETLRLLRLAAVIGRTFSRPVLDRVTAAQFPLMRHLGALMSHDLIHQVRIVPEPEYRFKHVLTQNVVYETQLVRRRRELHARVGRSIEELHADHLEEQYEVLAHHYGNSNDTERAIHYLELAGDKARWAYALVNAGNQYRASISKLDDLEASPELERRRIDLTLKFSFVSRRMANPEKLEVLQRAHQAAEELQDTGRLAETTFHISAMLQHMGKFTLADSYLRRSAEMARVLKNDTLLGRCHVNLASNSWNSARYAEGIEKLEQGVALLRREGTMYKIPHAPALIASCYGSMGDFAAAAALAEEGLALAKQYENKISEAQAYYFLSDIQKSQGNWEELFALADKGIALAHEIGNHRPAFSAMAYKGYGIVMVGRRSEGIRAIQEACEQIEGLGSVFTLGHLYGLLAEAHALDGNTGRALRFADKAMKIGKLGGGRRGDAFVYRALAMAAAKKKPADWATVEKSMRRAIKLARERGERPQLAINHFRYAELLCGKGDLKQARSHLKKATDQFTEMGMAWWLGEAGRLENILTAS